MWCHAVRSGIQRCLLMILVLGMPSIMAAQESSDTPIQVNIVPAQTDTAEPGDDPASSPHGTGTETVTMLMTLAPMTSDDTAYSAQLVVVDERPVATGWVVSIGPVATPPDREPPLLDAYTRRTEALDGRPLVEDSRPRGVRLSIGQPLDRTTLVMVAPPGAGQGGYSVRFAIINADFQPATELIVSMKSAP